MQEKTVQANSTKKVNPPRSQGRQQRGNAGKFGEAKARAKARKQAGGQSSARAKAQPQGGGSSSARTKAQPRGGGSSSARAKAQPQARGQTEIPATRTAGKGTAMGAESGAGGGSKSESPGTGGDEKTRSNISRKGASTAGGATSQGGDAASSDASAPGSDQAASRAVLNHAVDSAVSDFQKADAKKLAKVLLGAGDHSDADLSAVEGAVRRYQSDPASLRPADTREAEIGDIRDPDIAARDVLPVDAEGAWDPATNTALIASDILDWGGKYLKQAVREEAVGGPLGVNVSEDTGVEFSGDPGARVSHLLGGGSVKEANSRSRKTGDAPDEPVNTDARVNGNVVSGIPAGHIDQLIIRGTYVEPGAIATFRRTSDRNKGRTVTVTDGYRPDNSTYNSQNNYVSGRDFAGYPGEVGIRNPNIFGGSPLIVTIDNENMPDVQFQVTEDHPNLTKLTSTGQGDNSHNAPWVQRKHISFDKTGPYFSNTDYPNERRQYVTLKATDAGVKYLRNYRNDYSYLDNFSSGTDQGADPYNNHIAARVARAKEGTFTLDDKYVFRANARDSNKVNSGID